RKDHAFLHDPRVVRLKVSSDICRLLMQRTADSVTAEVPNDTQAAPARNTFDRVTDSIKPRSRPHLMKRGIKCTERCRAHSFLQGNIRGHGEGRTRVSEVSTDSRANIDIDHVASTQPSRPRNPMGNFLIDTDACSARETIRQLRR